MGYFEAISRSPTGKESGGTGKLWKKDVKSGKDVFKTDCTRAHLCADKNGLSQEEKPDKKGEHERAGNDGSNHMRRCGERDGGLQLRVEWVFDGHTEGSPTVREGEARRGGCR